MDTKQVILELRTQKGMSQDELAEKVFVSRQAVVEIKNDLIRTMGECR
ncbi:MAG: helix-turn-helix transcriptional regulator, partial [Ruminococcus sp.]